MDKTRENILKTLIVNVCANKDGEVTFDKKYIEYGGQAYDMDIKVSERKDTITFTSKMQTSERLSNNKRS